MTQYGRDLEYINELERRQILTAGQAEQARQRALNIYRGYLPDFAIKGVQ